MAELRLDRRFQPVIHTSLRIATTSQSEARVSVVTNYRYCRRLLGRKQPASYTTFQSTMKEVVDIRKDRYSNVGYSGGTTTLNVEATVSVVPW